VHALTFNVNNKDYHQFLWPYLQEQFKQYPDLNERFTTTNDYYNNRRKHGLDEHDLDVLDICFSDIANVRSRKGLIPEK